jgi:hypothetical protein
MSYAPIVFLAFNRPVHTARSISALQKNFLASHSPIYIFCDAARGPKDLAAVEEVRSFARRVTGFKSVTVIERPHNFGLAASVLDSVNKMTKEFGRVIVLEDDLITSPHFLTYMNEALELYANDPKVASIHGYAYPTNHENAPQSYFLRGADCWGWGTWARAWEHLETDGRKLLNELTRQKLRRSFDYDGVAPYTRMLKNRIRGRNQSWAILWHASTYLKGMLTLYPAQSLVSNTGFDDTGVHCSSADYFDSDIGTFVGPLEKIATEEDVIMREHVSKFFLGVQRKRWRNALRSPIPTIRRLVKSLFIKKSDHAHG